MPKYHVALSFAGEDRDYVEKVANQLRADGVDVFYDKFEEADLWGKNLYEHLSNIYQNMALFTVMFISDAYKNKVWPNHERRSAQARAIADSKEYILPAFFDNSIEVPGLLKTTGRVSLATRTPEQLAALIVKKLQNSGVKLKQQFSYSDHAKADADFPLTRGRTVSDLVKAMKSYNWYEQNPAVVKLLDLDWTKITPDEAFVLGRNLYQCACGNERKALSILGNLRRELAALSDDRALDFLSGMFFEVYFNANGEFRGRKLKGRCLDKLLALQTVSKFAPSVAFIRRALEPYQHELLFRPNVEPEDVVVDLTVRRSDPPTVRSLKIGASSILTDHPQDDDSMPYVWRLSFQTFTIKELAQRLADEWSIPLTQLTINCRPQLDPKTKLALPEGWGVAWPKRN
jgi:hypothetical protein